MRILCVFALSIGLTSTAIGADSSGMPQMPPTTAEGLKQVARAACAQAVERESNATRLVTVTDVTLPPQTSDRLNCTVSAKVGEGPGVYMANGKYTTRNVVYNVAVDVKTGKADVARVDEAAAAEVALAGLAQALIEIKPTSISKDSITYTALMSGKKCVVDVALEPLPEPKRWLIKSLRCSKK